MLFLSWSQLRHQSECRQKAHLLRQGKKAKDTNIRVYFPGTLCDRVMRAWLEDEAREPGGMVTHPEYGVAATLVREEQAAKDSGDGIVRWKSANDRREVAELCARALTYLEPDLREKILPVQFQPAKKFRVPVQIPDLQGNSTTIALVGEMDILAYDSEHVGNQPWVIWDLKITKDDSYWRKTIGQLVFYDLAVFAMFGQYTSSAGLLQPLCKQKAVSIEIENQQRIEMMQRIIAMAHAVWREDFAIAPTTKHCYMCAVKNACPRFTPVGGRMSLGSSPFAEDLANLQPASDLLEYTVDDLLAEDGLVDQHE